MRSITTLSDEHKLILGFLETLIVAEQAMVAGARLPREFFEGFVEFARDFADAFHHRKEEYEVFVRLAERHDGTIDHHIEALRQQHDTGRERVAAVARELDAYERGSQLAELTILEQIAAYRATLTIHIHREDNVFFPLAREVLTEDDDRALMALFREQDERMDPDFLADSREMVAFMRRLAAAARGATGGSPG